MQQIAALPLGSRIKLDPWDDHVEMKAMRPVPLYSARDKMPLEVTPFFLNLARYAPAAASQNANAKTPDSGKEVANTDPQ